MLEDIINKNLHYFLKKIVKLMMKHQILLQFFYLKNLVFKFLNLQLEILVQNIIQLIKIEMVNQ